LSVLWATLFGVRDSLTWLFSVASQTFYNLGLLTGDLWSIAFAVVLEGVIPNAGFYCAFVLIISGVILYETAPSLDHPDGASSTTSSPTKSNRPGSNGFSVGANDDGGHPPNSPASTERV
jgi:Solute carrier family 35